MAVDRHISVYELSQFHYMEFDLNNFATAGSGFLAGMIYTAGAIGVIARGPVILRYMFERYGRSLYFLGALFYALAFGVPIYLAVYGLTPLEALQLKNQVLKAWAFNGIAFGALLGGIIVFLIDAHRAESQKKQ
jgi:hypothetical protein